MFGYVKVFKPELKVREYEEYKGVYCTLCRTLGKEFGQTMRMTLSYDATFYVLLSAMVKSKENPEFKTGRCAFNPAKKCQYQQNDAAIYKDAAALTVILSYQKLVDDKKDSGFFKKCAVHMVFPLLKAKYKKAKKSYPRFAEIAEETMRRQAEAENRKTASTDEAAEPTARGLEYLFTEGIPEGTQKTVLARTAYCVGRFVYLIDAYDDMKSDFKSGAYNPFLLKYEIQEEEALYSEAVHEDILKTLHLTANEAALAFNLLDGKLHRGILENILYDGLEEQITAVRKTYEKVRKSDGESL